MLHCLLPAWSLLPFFWMLLVVVWELIGPFSVTKEMKGWLFVLLLAALLFLGGYITFVSKYVTKKFICFTVLNLFLIQFLI